MTNVINTLKLVAPEFGTMSDDDIQSWVSLAEPFVSKKVFGKLYTQALAYLTAHMMKMSGNGDTSKGTVGDSMRVASCHLTRRCIRPVMSMRNSTLLCTASDTAAYARCVYAPS